MEKYMLTVQEAKLAATQKAKDYLDKWFGGQDRGACGFAWVQIVPKHNGNTKEGKAERKALRQMGFELDHTGKEFTWWNPCGLGVQNVEVKAEGARAAAKVLIDAGFNAYARSRLD